MIKSDIINNVARAADISRVKAVVAVEAVLDAMKRSMKKGERIELRGFGVFQVNPGKKGSDEIPAPGWKSGFRRARPFDSSQEKIFATLPDPGIPRNPREQVTLTCTRRRSVFGKVLRVDPSAPRRYHPDGPG